MSKKHFHNIESKYNLLDLIHSDIYEINRGDKCFLIFIDNHSRFCYIELMKHKDEAFSMFKIYKVEVKNQLIRKIKILRSDMGDEYFCNKFNLFVKKTWYSTSILYT